MSTELPKHLEENGAKATAVAFFGYSTPTSSTTYTPNQFFDVVLPNASRGCLRLVAYLLHRTLGMSNPDGTPMYPETHATYKDLIEKAGISRGALKPAIDEAIANRYIDCLRFGEPHTPGNQGFAALYSLRWDKEDRYVTDPKEFDGFYQGNGNLTSIPNDFFNYTVPNEPLAVVRVIGAIARHTIGWQVRVGMRRQQVAMSFSEMMKRTGIASRSTLVIAINSAIDSNHIIRVSEGVFDPHSPVPTTWSLRWADDGDLRVSMPTVEPTESKGSKIEPGDAFNNRPSDLASVQKSNQIKRSKIEPAKGSKIEPASVQKSNQQAFKNRTTIKITSLNNFPKQQQTEFAVAECGSSLSLLVKALMDEGLTPKVASELVELYPEERIRRQLSWLGSRKIKSSRTGLLIACIEQDIPEAGVQTSEQSTPSHTFAMGFYSGLMGHEREVLTEPSDEDDRQAERFLHRAKLPNDADLGESGSQFYRFVKSKDQGKRDPIRTLSLAVRIYGDEFLAQSKAARRATLQQSVLDAKKAHEEQFQGAYQEFLLTFAPQIEDDRDLASKFESHIEEKIQLRRRISPRAAQMLVDEVADPNQRMRLFIEYAASQEMLSIPSFWDWDKSQNPTPFSKERYI